MRRVLFPLLAALFAASCAHVPAPTASITQPAAVRAASETITPDEALARAAQKARAWQPDARLVAVAWAVAKFELTSVVYHLFQSPQADRLYVVQTKLVSVWQDGHEVSDPRYTLPARFLDTLGTYPTGAHAALATAKTYLPADQAHPVSLLVEVKPARLLPAVWGVKADAVKALIDAETGQVLVHTTRDLPPLPF